MPSRPDWRILSDYDYLNQLDRAGLAWEFLRRNPEYRKDFAKIIDVTSPDAMVIAERWGLCFRLRPISGGLGRFADLEA